MNLCQRSRYIDIVEADTSNCVNNFVDYDAGFVWGSEREREMRLDLQERKGSGCRWKKETGRSERERSVWVGK